MIYNIPAIVAVALIVLVEGFGYITHKFKAPKLIQFIFVGIIFMVAIGFVLSL